VQKCVPNGPPGGVLTEERPGVYSLGHLTFQEHLVGEYLAYDSRIEDIAKRVGSDWWREALNFYASVKGDVTELIDRLLATKRFGSSVGQISEMARYAPYTSAGAMDAVKYERQIQKEERKQDPDF